MGPVSVVRSPDPLGALPSLTPGSVALRVAPLVPALGPPGLWWVCGGILGGGRIDAGLGLIPWCFPLVGPMLALPVRV